MVQLSITITWSRQLHGYKLVRLVRTDFRNRPIDIRENTLKPEHVHNWVLKELERHIVS